MDIFLKGNLRFVNKVKELTNSFLKKEKQIMNHVSFQKLVLLCLLILTFSNYSFSSHIVGGDTRIEQVSQNNFILKKRLFRFCTGIPYPINLTGKIYDKLTDTLVKTIAVSRVSYHLISFGDTCYSPPGLCVEVYNYSASFTLPNNPNGYYYVYTNGIRNPGLVNLVSGNSVWYCNIPDPAILNGNSNPKFVDYPSDGYLCRGYDKQIDFSCIDLDGDSLVYSLQTPNDIPLGAQGGKPFLPATFNRGYSLSRVFGVNGSCTIDSNTGIVTANPVRLGIYVIAVKCEEYRNGVKIGEVFRDIQYAALNCVVTTFNNDSVCVGDSTQFVSTVATSSRINTWDFGDGTALSNLVSPKHSYVNPGVYQVRHTSKRPRSNCIDSVTLDVVVLPQLIARFNYDTACFGFPIHFSNSSLGSFDKIKWDLGDGYTDSIVTNLRHTYGAPGNYFVELKISNNGFCEQTIQQQITISGKDSSRISMSVCNSYTSPTGKIWNATGVYTDTLLNQNGCDSIVTIDLTIHSTSQTTQIVSVCNSYTSPTGKIWNATGIYTDTLLNQNGCDSIVTIDLTIHSTSQTSQIVSVCDTYTSPSGKIWNATGIYLDTLLNQNGCDSIVTIDLTIHSTSQTTQIVSVCDNYTSPSGKIWNTTGIYLDTLLNQNGCDSIVTIDLTIHSTSQTTQIVSVCNSYTSPTGKFWNATGIYLDTLLNQNGCDSTVTIDLTIHSTSQTTQIISTCNGYTSPSGKSWGSSGIFFDTLTGKYGCDSIIKYHIITFRRSMGMPIVLNLCDSFVLPGTGKKIFQSGVYIDTVPSNNGCDNYVRYFLTIQASNNSIMNASTCDTYVSPSGKVWNTSGVFTDTLSNQNGCDSIVTINLTIHSKNQTTQIVSVCNSYTSPTGKIWKVTGIYSDTLSNSNGCDSIITIHLTVNHTSFSSITASVCDVFVSPSGNIFSVSGIYKDTLQNSVGCDSIVSINLTVNHIAIKTITVSVCDSFVSPSGIVWTTSGYFNDTLKSISGCDSIVVYDLTVNKCKFTFIKRSSCDSLVYNGVVYSSSQTIVDTLPIRTGCDSIITCEIELTSTPVLSILTSVNIGYQGEEMVMEVGGAAYYEWENGSFDSIRNVDLSSVSQMYCVRGYNSPTCFLDTCIEIEVKQSANIFAPNTFTPNNDGVNDCFSPVLVDVDRENYVFQIFNKWGEEVFFTTELDQCWDGSRAGQTLKSDIYVWKVTCVSEQNNLPMENQGHIFLKM